MSFSELVRLCCERSNALQGWNLRATGGRLVFASVRKARIRAHTA